MFDRLSLAGCAGYSGEIAKAGWAYAQILVCAGCDRVWESMMGICDGVNCFLRRRRTAGSLIYRLPLCFRIVAEIADPGFYRGDDFSSASELDGLKK